MLLNKKINIYNNYFTRKLYNINIYILTLQPKQMQNYESTNVLKYKIYEENSKHYPHGRYDDGSEHWRKQL